MTKETVKKGKSTSAKADKSQNSIEFNKIIEGLKSNSKIISDAIKSRVGPGDWKFMEAAFKLEESKDSIDIVFSAPDGKKEKYVILDISVPHLQIGQKYALPAKAKVFQKQQNVPLTRIKKAIILVRKGTETISARPASVRCPIIEIQLEKIIPVEKIPEARPVKDNRDNRDNRDGRDAKDSRDNRDNKDSRDNREAPEKKPQNVQGVSPELLFALKEAIVHECLSTMHKRRNKYIRKGLWRWIEREIMDPNAHFFLIILSTIYQGKTGEVLSRRFKTPESFSAHAEDAISAIFSKETNLADEIKKSSERHKKALRKFLACFSQTPPFEYLRTLFLKEFRSGGDGLKARMSVFTTLNQLLERCGFEGEKETQYPLEILDELGIFQGIMTGNYTQLRIDNAAKKLKHLVPQAEWGEEDIYLLRNQLAKALNLPPQEFNLNAFLPQAFFHDARVMAETRKDAFRGAPRPGQERQPQQAPRPEVANNKRAPEQDDRQERLARPEKSNRPDRHARPERTDRTDRQDTVDKNDRPERQPRADRPDRNNRDDRFERPRHEPAREAAVMESPDIEERPAEYVGNDSSNDRSDHLQNKRRLVECDEAGHRNFEFYGGHLDEDIDSIRLALAMCRYESDKREATKQAEATAALTPDLTEAEEELLHRPPVKANNEMTFPANHVPPRKRPSQGANRNNNNRRRKPGQGNKLRPRRTGGQDNTGMKR